MRERSQKKNVLLVLNFLALVRQLREKLSEANQHYHADDHYETDGRYKAYGTSKHSISHESLSSSQSSNFKFSNQKVTNTNKGIKQEISLNEFVNKRLPNLKNLANNSQNRNGNIFI